jgi:uracil-DNA glycosylase family 4
VDRPLDQERHALTAAARAWLEELAEEGVEALHLPDVAAAPTPDPEASPEPEPGTVRRSEPASAPRDESEASPEPPPASQPVLVEAREWAAGTDLESVRTALGDCTRCRLHEGRTNLVFGDGNPQADLMFVGEGPGEQEDLRGLPFVGRAGELLTQMIEKGLGIPRSDVYICNVVKCRPPGNRTPLADEVSTCSPFLDGQIAAVKPRVIVTLGKPAASLLLGRDVAITRVRGTWQEYKGIPLMPTLHPAYILRQYTAENRRLVWEDLKAALAKAKADASA